MVLVLNIIFISEIEKNRLEGEVSEGRMGIFKEKKSNRKKPENTEHKFPLLGTFCL